MSESPHPPSVPVASLHRPRLDPLPPLGPVSLPPSAPTQGEGGGPNWVTGPSSRWWRTPGTDSGSAAMGRGCSTEALTPPGPPLPPAPFPPGEGGGRSVVTGPSSRWWSAPASGSGFAATAPVAGMEGGGNPSPSRTRRETPESRSSPCRPSPLSREGVKGGLAGRVGEGARGGEGPPGRARPDPSPASRRRRGRRGAPISTPRKGANP